MVWFLPIGLCVAILVSLLLPQPGAFLNEQGLLPWVIAGIFLINGFQTTLADARVGEGFAKCFSITFAICLVIGPVIGWFFYRFLDLSADLMIGLVVMSVVPTTLSSCVVLTRLVNGHAQWALWFTLALNFLGILTIPLALSLIIGADVEMDGWGMLSKLAIMVALPFTLGILLRSRFKALQLPGWVGHVPTSLVIAGAWMTLSSSQQQLTQLSLHNLLLILVFSALVHGILLAVSWVSGPLFKLSYGQHMAVLFSASQKTMPIAVSVIVTLSPTMGVAVITCVIFHTLQMLIDSSLAGLINRHKRVAATA